MGQSDPSAVEPSVPLGERALRVTVPGLRLAGFLTLSFLLAVHSLAIDPSLPWTRVLGYLAVSVAYTGITWVLLRRAPSGAPLAFVADRVAEGDVLLWAGAMAYSGGGDSWLFPLMILRAADHVTYGFRRVLVLGHVSTAAFLGLLLWTANWSLDAIPAAGWGKLAGVWGFNVYLSWTAAAVDRLNERLRRVRRELRLARDAAEDSSRAKTAFLATMSHELRTPLNAIIGYSQLLQEECAVDTPRLVPDLQKIDRAGHQLLGLVNDVLDLSKVEAGMMDVSGAECDLAPIVREVGALMQAVAGARGNDLRVETPDRVAAWADERRLRQVMLNLVGNACKFTEGGEIRVVVRSDQAAAYIDVSDTGIGIPPEQLGRIFDAFVQVDPNPTRRYEGTGLGLALARRMCQAMAGELAVTSRLGAGSTFTVSLPLGPREPREALHRPVVESGASVA